MAEEHCKIGKIYWSETFPFVRLFSTFKRAISFRALLLAFGCVLLCYVSGRVLDAIWKAADAGVPIGGPSFAAGESPTGLRAAYGRTARSEIAAYASLDAQTFRLWRQQAAAHERDEDAAERDRTPELDQQIADMLSLIDKRLDKGLAQIDEDAEIAADEKEQAREELCRAVDMLRFTLEGHDALRLDPVRAATPLVATVLSTDPEIEAQQLADERTQLTKVLAEQRSRIEMDLQRPRGPFISLLNYERCCFAAAVQGVCSGRWGLSGSALSGEPAMLGSIASAGNGVLWLVTQRPCFAVIFTLVLLVIFGFFGGAICRVTAVASARDESLSFREALRFSGGKFAALVAAPLLPVGIFVIAGFLIFIGGLVAAIPWLETVAGLTYGLTLLGGVVLAGALLAVVLGFHLMWPTIAVEASDAFDAVSRSASYVFQRAWHVGFYSFVLLLYGAVSFVVVRIIGMLVLKLSHVATGAGMNLVSSAETSTVGKLDAIWRMPAWQDLPLLPALGDVNFWGSFGNAPLSGTESFATFFFALWVFIVVGLVGAFVVSFYFCGSTEMYFLLRREYDAVDYDEIYYEESEDEYKEDEADEAEEAEQPAESEQPGGEPPAAE